MFDPEKNDNSRIIRFLIVIQILLYAFLYVASIDVSVIIGVVLVIFFAITVIVATFIVADKLISRDSKPSKLKSIPSSPNRNFDRLTARVISLNTGMRAELTTPGARAEGVDVNLYRSGARVGIVRCVKHDPLKPLPAKYVRELAKLKDQQEAEYAYLVTNAFFSDKSQNEAEKQGISLIDSREFKKLKARAKQILREEKERKLTQNRIGQNVFDTDVSRDTRSRGYLRGHQ